MTAVCGVYTIVNNVNGNVYIGSSVNIHRRKLRHFKHLQSGTHENIHLQRAYDKYGESAFSFNIIKKTSIETRLYEEQLLLNEHYGKLHCYNICGIAGSPSVAGREKSLLHKQKLSKSLKQYYINNPQHKTFLSNLRKGKLLSDDTKQKMRSTKKRGIKHHNSKLTDDVVRQIRNKYRPIKYSYGRLAEEYGVDKKTIIRIIQNKTWTHVK